MKILIFIAVSTAISALAEGVFVPPRPGQHQQKLGAKECTWGPGYWCQNLTAAASCHATKHCIQTVWVHKTLPPDSSSICQTCLDMVKQARDQLESNETQELIKEVFEGTCALIHIKPVVKECDKIADSYIPDLIDTLASEMNPQVVCAVAGLCNSEKIQKALLEGGKGTVGPLSVPVPEMGTSPRPRGDTCSSCYSVVGVVQEKLAHATRDDVLQGFLRQFCGKLGSFSDACSNTVVTYFSEMYKYLTENFNQRNICLLAGECTAQFHTHANVEITPMSKIGYVKVPGSESDDMPCELCEQLVRHLRDVLIANTTEDEFEAVMEGICRQTGKFSQECVDLVHQYYAVAYQFLVAELNATAVCAEIGICPAARQTYPLIAPLLPVETASKLRSDGEALHRVSLSKGASDVKAFTPGNLLLPIDVLVPPHTQLYSQQFCVFCEYFLHYVQQQITQQATEAEIRDVLDKACTRLPTSINATCVQFVETYEPALIAILAQEIDPSVVCPMIRACPSEEAQHDVEVFMRQTGGDSKCPLCLYAVTELEQMVKDKKTKENIKDALDKLCAHLPNTLVDECNDFVNTYTDQLVEMLIADFKPQEVCVYLKLCTDNKPPTADVVLEVPEFAVGNTNTNEIYDNTVNGKPAEAELRDGTCVLCEFVMKEIEDQLKNNKTEDEVKTIVKDVCSIMPKSVRKECDDFIDEYAETIIILLQEAFVPNEICSMIGLCSGSLEPVKEEILDCAICEAAVEAMDKILSNPKVDHNVIHVLEKTCRALPHHYRQKCTHIISKHGKDIFDLLVNHTSKHLICKSVQLCAEHPAIPLHQTLGSNPCTFGPSYWCENEENAEQCGTTQHCVEKVWNMRQKKSNLVGSNPCTRGPGYWCQSKKTAAECGDEARQHCTTKVWNNRQKRSNLVGGNLCTRGPGYWCQSEKTAAECGDGATQHCTTKVWNKRQKRSNLLGSNRCSRGPGYWCQSDETAAECGEGARQHCTTKVWNKRQKRSNLVGSNPCTRGPGYWCQSEKTAAECGEGARQHCTTKVWRQKRSNLVGGNLCTRGPGYWCQSEKTAAECGDGATQHCTTKVWNKRQKRSSLLGSNRCTRGPGYWCQSQKTAEECGAGAVKHCSEKVW